MRGAAVAVAVAALHAGPALTAATPLRRRLLPGLAGLARGDSVALTFDDGPDATSTPAFLDRLAEFGVPATFFVLGEMLAHTPGVARRARDEGHEIAVHGWTHRNHLRLTPCCIVREVTRTADLIERVTGERPRLFRPPYGVLTGVGLAAARRAGLRPLLWSTWGRDWRPTATAASVLADLGRGGLRPGATALLHDSDCTSAPGSWASSLAALAAIVAAVEAAGGHFVRASDHLS